LEIAKSGQLLGEATNIGAGEEISIGDLARLIATLMQKNVSIMEDKQRLRPGKSEVERLVCDNSKMLQMTSWTPRHDLNKGLLETIRWVEQHQDLYKAEIYNV
jgi:dTDP-glucose 4,6-dehydratase